MPIRIISLCFCLFYATIVLGQTPTTTVSGQVNDQQSGEAIIGATIQLMGKTDTVGVLSDELGKFSIAEVAAGRYELLIKYLGYRDHRVSEIELISGRQLELAIGLQEAIADLPMAVVRGDVRAATNIAPTSIQTLTIEEVRRFPATYNDPARLALAYPGVANANDQANELIIRGNSPAGVSWRIAGAEIVNPNHLSNAGNQFDRVSDSGGGVNALSAQLLKSSYFLSGAFPAQYGNALSGVMDMNLRPGNRNKWESTVQLGLLGLDFAFEGPFSKNKKASYLVNYRYSTIGLLDALGVPVSDESISFQDLALHFNFPTKNAGEFSLFGIGGKSSNVLEAKADSVDWLRRRDRSDIDYQSKLGILGGSHEKNFKKLAWKTTLIFSGADNSRLEGYYQKSDLAFVERTQDSLSQSKLAFHTSAKFYQSEKLHLLFGLESNFETFALYPSQGDLAIVRSKLNGWLIQPYISAHYKLGQRLSLDAGFRFVHATINNQSAALPRMNVSYQLSPADKTSLSWGSHVRKPPFYLGFVIGDILDFIKADHITLSHTHHFKSSNFLKAELYYQGLYDVPISESSMGTFSALNVEEVVPFYYSRLVNNGEGKNIGVELSWQQYLQKDFYYLVNGSLFNSQYKDREGSWRNTRYNSKYIISLTGGKEFSWNKKWPRRLGININFNASGGQWHTPINVFDSRLFNRQIFNDALAFSEQYPDYYRVDLRIYLRTNKNKRSTSLSLDIQNITNRKNFAYFYYDLDSQEIETQEQLGLIPILNWRIDL